MPDTLEQAPRGKALQAFLEDEGVRAALPTIGAPLPDDVRHWLGQVLLLYGVPFNNLVADSRMLPPESIRFFFLDQNWLDSLLHGVLSVVQLGAPDSAILDTLRASIRQDAIDAAREERDRRRDRRRSAAALAEAGLTPAPCQMERESAAPAEVWTGFLLRSTVVSDFPGLELAAYADDGRQQPLDLLRVDRLAPTVLLAIFGGIARTVDIARPTQALHFGVERFATAEDLRVFLRGIGDQTGSAHPAGAQLTGHPSVSVPLRRDRRDRRVLDLTALRRELQDGLQRAYGSSPLPPLNPGAFAIQMLAGSERQCFDAQALRREPPDGG